MGAPTRVYSSFVPARSVKQNHQHAKSVFEYGCTTGKILSVRASVASTFVAINSRFGNVLFPANRFLKMGHAITRQLPMQYISCTILQRRKLGVARHHIRNRSNIIASTTLGATLKESSIDGAGTFGTLR